MMQKLTAHAERRARERAAARALEIAGRLAEGAPPDVDVETMQGGVRLSGRGLARRFAFDPALRWLTVEPRR